MRGTWGIWWEACMWYLSSLDLKMPIEHKYYHHHFTDVKARHRVHGLRVRNRTKISWHLGLFSEQKLDNIPQVQREIWRKRLRAMFGGEVRGPFNVFFSFSHIHILSFSHILTSHVPAWSWEKDSLFIYITVAPTMMSASFCWVLYIH